ncbi:hypothetical protein MTR67_024280 [Solanum verrucosum]|uniref:Uncharacterized protein n=1 Tax=Solanum verrucosum TaxID=315347 RepID=A0AAF0TYC7_SOLVR|nr:hypothetical protein MTR67_024280 [Solanum verrucosum]
MKNAAARTNVASAATAESQSRVNAGPSAGCTPSAGLISARRPTNASSSGVRLATTLASGGRPASATSSDVRQLSTQQSTSSATGQKRKTSTALRGGATLAYKKPIPKKAKTTGYGLLFGSSGSVTERLYISSNFVHQSFRGPVLRFLWLADLTKVEFEPLRLSRNAKEEDVLVRTWRKIPPVAEQ